MLLILARNNVIFGVDNSSSSHTDNHKNNFLVLAKGPTYDINGSFGSAEKRVSIYFTRAKFRLSVHYNNDNSYLLINEKEIYKFKVDHGTINFPTQFYQGSISNEFGASREVSFKGNVYNCLVNFNATYKSNILSIHKYLMV